MAHVAKLTKAAAGHLCKHYERAKDENGEYLRFGNQDIDPSRSEQNYNLAPDHTGGQMEFIQKRCQAVKCLNRKDVNVMCSWIVTAPKPIAGNIEIEKNFFDETYRFLTVRYGKENIVSAYVHMDEMTPHIHFAFVPVIADKKTGKQKVSAKEVVDRRDLQSFHTDLDRHMFHALGEHYQGGILNGATMDGNRSIEELKKLSAADRLAETERETAKIIKQAEQQANRIRDEINLLQRELEDLRSQTSDFKNVLSTAYEINSMGKKSLIGDKITLTAKEAHHLKEQAKECFAARSEATKAIQDAERLRQRYISLEKIDRDTVPALRKEVRDLIIDKNEATRKFNKALAVVDSDPTLSQIFDKQLKIFNEREKAEQQQRHRGYDMER